MKSASSLVAALVWILACAAGCGPYRKAAPGTQARWEKQLDWKKTAPLARLPADSAPRCLKDRLSDPQFLRQEVARLERARGGAPIAGAWRDKDLSAFAPAQAQFLSANDSWIAAPLDLSSCNDLPCILNQVYGSSAGDPGLKIYSFYLSMGYSLSCRDYVPKIATMWTEQPASALFKEGLAAHLFSDSELTSFRKLSYLLPESYRFMGQQRFHRVPDGDQVPEAAWCASGEINDDNTCKCPAGKSNPDGSCQVLSATCGDSWGTKSQGFIRVKRCIEEDNYIKEIYYTGDEAGLPDNGIRGQFYMTLTHEMTHAWDRAQASSTLNSQLLSFTDEWKELSGWSQQTVVEPAASDGMPGVKHSRWVSDPSGDGFVRDYAGSDPREDLAETSAWVRFRPTLAAERSPKKTAYLSRKLFGGRTYDPAGLLSSYVGTTVQSISPDLLQVVDHCLTDAAAQSHAVAAVAQGTPHLSLDHPLPQAIVACLESELNTRIDAALDVLRATEWEACDTLASREREIRVLVFDRLSADVSRYVSQNIDRVPAIRASQQLRLALGTQVDPREAYTHCFSQAQPEVCYQQVLSDAFDRVAQAFAKDLGDMISDEKTNFLAQNAFQQSQNSTNQFYRQIFAGVDPLVSAAALSRWQSCLSVAPSASGDAMPRVSPFSGGVHFVSTDILNCVNGGLEEDLKKTRDSFISRMGLSVSDGDVQALIQSLLLPGYLEALKAQEELAATAEDAIRAQRKSGVIDVLGAQLAQDTSWLADAVTADVAQARCMSAASQAFDVYFSHVGSSEQLPARFAAIADIRNSWSHDACQRVVASGGVAQVLAQRAQSAWVAATAALENAVKTRASDKATDCIARYPSHVARVAPATTKASRRACLTAAQGWAMIETQALVDWGQSADGKNFALSRKTDAASYLTAHRKALQAAATNAMESR